MSKDKDIFAFPTEAIGDRSVPLENDYIQTSVHHGKFPGMTLRDYFADSAMRAFLNCLNSEESYVRISHISGKEGIKIEEWIARKAYRQAEAMLEERLK